MKKESITNLRKQIGIYNRSVWGYIVTWIIAMLVVLMIGNEPDVVAGSFMDRLQFILLSMLLMVMTNSYIAKYTKIYREKIGANKADDKQIGWLILDCEDLLSVLKNHGFDVTAYYAELAKRFFPMIPVSIIIVFVFGMTNLVYRKAIPYVCTMFVLIPAIVFLIRYLKTFYEMTHRKGVPVKIVEELCKAIFGMMRLMAVGVSVILLLLLVSGILSGYVRMRGTVDTEPIRFSSDAGILIVGMMITAMIAAIYLTDMDRDMLRFPVVSKRKWGVILSVGLCLLMIGAYAYIMENEYVKLTEDKIVVASRGDLREYGMDDIVGYRIYGTDEFKMELTFTDGTKTNIFRSVSDDTTAWSDLYETDFQYAAGLSTLLKKRGITGTVDDLQKMENYVGTLDPICQDGFREIIRNLE